MVPPVTHSFRLQRALTASNIAASRRGSRRQDATFVALFQGDGGQLAEIRAWRCENKSCRHRAGWRSVLVYKYRTVLTFGTTLASCPTCMAQYMAHGRLCVRGNHNFVSKIMITSIFIINPKAKNPTLDLPAAASCGTTKIAKQCQGTSLTCMPQLWLVGWLVEYSRFSVGFAFRLTPHYGRT